MQITNEERVRRCIRRLYRAIDAMQGLSSEGIDCAEKLARDENVEGYALGDYYRYRMIAANEKRIRTAVEHMEKILMDD